MENYGVGSADNASVRGADDRSYGSCVTRSPSFSRPSFPFQIGQGNNSYSSISSLLTPLNQTSAPMKKVESSLSLSSMRSARKLSDASAADDPMSAYADDVDASRIYRAAQEAGSRAFGIVAVDVWLLEHGQFIHPEGGLWVSPVFRKQHPSDALSRIMNKNHRHYAQPLPQVPGAGLAGYFWALGVRPNSTQYRWRDLHAITSDPFQPRYTRMNVLEEAGIGKATGIPFDVLGHQGVVVFMARESASELMLNERNNVEYLKFSAQHLGTATALSMPRKASEEARHHRVSKTSRRVVTKMNTISAFFSLQRTVSSRSLASSISDNSLNDWKQSSMSRVNSLSVMGITIESTTQRIRKLWRQTVSQSKQRVETAIEKSRGSNLKPPPQVPLLNATWSFCGSFLTLLVLSAYAVFLRKHFGADIVLAPFGALLTLQFSLTAAPASQPRDMLYGQSISLTIALLAKTWLPLPDSILIPLAGALAIGFMTKLGCNHPPAAAAVIALFTEPEDFTVVTVVLMLVGNGIAILTAMLVNNLCEKRQYPVYWEFGVGDTIEEFCSLIGTCFQGSKEPGQDIELAFQEYLSVKAEPQDDFDASTSSPTDYLDGPIRV